MTMYVAPDFVATRWALATVFVVKPTGSRAHRALARGIVAKWTESRGHLALLATLVEVAHLLLREDPDATDRTHRMLESLLQCPIERGRLFRRSRRAGR